MWLGVFQRLNEREVSGDFFGGRALSQKVVIARGGLGIGKRGLGQRAMVDGSCSCGSGGI
jgi:hypothetical protein